MKLIHCSDIHLDSRMESNLSPAQAQTRSTELCTTFSRMAVYAREQQVDAVLIAGDLFDTERISSRTADYILDVVRRTPSVDFLYLKGNHDAACSLFRDRPMPDNLYLFSDQWTSYRYGTVVISGLEWTQDNWRCAYDTLHLDPADTNIVTLHGQTSSSPGPELVCLPLLRNKHISYLALGHIHSFSQGPLDIGSSWCYSGCLEGRGFDECGEKGFVLLEIGDHQVHSTFVPFACRTLHDLPVDISGKETVTELREAMAAAAATVPEKDLIKFTLTGTCTLQTQKDIPFLEQLLRCEHFFVKIKDESRLVMEKESYENDISLKGAFVRIVMASGLSDREKEQIICAGIQALTGEAITL